MSAKVKTIVNMTGEESLGEWDFQAGKISTDLDQSNPRNIRGLMLSSEGLMAYRGKDFIGIPKKELWALIEKVAPNFAFAPEPPSPAKPAGRPNTPLETPAE